VQPAPGKLPLSTKTPPRRSRSAFLCLLAWLTPGAFLWTGCTSENTPERALDRGLGYFREHVHEVDPGWANLFDYMNRRFQVEATTADGQPLHEVAERQERQEMAEIFRRLVDPAADIEKRRIAELESTIDRITASALHCDRIPLPGDWVQILEKSSDFGGYALTHSALAGEWTFENGCRSWDELAGLRRRQIELLIEQVEEGFEQPQAGEASLDIWIESIVMLYYLGAGSRVNPEWIDTLLEQQRRDGGWPRSHRAKGSNPHPTALALWVLLEQLQPDAPAITWVARPAR
jgi:hypothetical protein